MSDAKTPRRAPDDAPTNALFEILSHPRRRRALRILRQAPGPISVETLAERLDADEGGDSGAVGRQGPPGPDAARRPGTLRFRPSRTPSGSDGIRAELIHVHLPKLAAAGLVAHDEEARTVHRRPAAAAADAHLDATVAPVDPAGGRFETGAD